MKNSSDTIGNRSRALKERDHLEEKEVGWRIIFKGI